MEIMLEYFSENLIHFKYLSFYKTYGFAGYNMYENSTIFVDLMFLYEKSYVYASFNDVFIFYF